MNINKIWQKELETQLVLWAPRLVQRMINHKQITSDVTYTPHKGWGLVLVGYFPMWSTKRVAVAGHLVYCGDNLMTTYHNSKIITSCAVPLEQTLHNNLM